MKKIFQTFILVFMGAIGYSQCYIASANAPGDHQIDPYCEIFEINVNLNNFNCGVEDFEIQLDFDPRLYSFTNAQSLGFVETYYNAIESRVRFVGPMSVATGQSDQTQFLFQMKGGLQNPGGSHWDIKLRSRELGQPNFPFFIANIPYTSNMYVIEGDVNLTYLQNLPAPIFHATSWECDDGAPYPFYLDGILRIDTDWCFKMPCGTCPSQNKLRIKLAPGSKIIVEPGIEFNMQEVEISKCGTGVWKTIEVKNNAVFNIENSIVTGGLDAITVLNGGVLNADGTEFLENATCISVESGTANLVDNVFSKSSKGVYVTGNNPMLPTFDGNVFDELPIGVHVENNQNRVDLVASLSNRNIFDHCVRGIQINNGAANVRYNKFIENNTAIDMSNNVVRSDIFFNEIGYVFTGIRSSNGFFDVYDNNIGLTDGKGGNGIVIIGDNINSQIRENHIYAKRNGVFSIFSSGVNIHDNPDINASTSPGIFTAGIHMLASDNNIVDNYVTINNAKSGILLNACPTPGTLPTSNEPNEVAYNEVDAHTGTNTSGILLTGASISQNVKYNVALGNLTDGILAVNSTQNNIECNDLTALDNGISVSNNSTVQTLEGNSTYAPVDLRTRSVLTPQIHHGNKFYGADINDETDGTAIAESMSAADIMQSMFFVDKNALVNFGSPYSDYWPEVHTQGLFLDVPTAGSQTTFMCSGSPGPGFAIPTDEFLCHLLGNLDNYEKQFVHASKINLYHWLLFYLERVPSSGWPSCLYNAVNNQYCSEILDVAKAQHDLTELFSAKNNPDNMPFRRALINQGLNQVKGDLYAVSCVDGFIEKYKSVLLYLISYTQTSTLDNSAITELEAIAKLCPAENGDAVHWARSLLSLTEDDRYDLNDESCGSVAFNVKEAQNFIGTNVKVFPNPASDNITIAASDELAEVQIFDQIGRLVFVEKVQDKEVNINVSSMQNGIYWIKTQLENGNFETKKISIIK